MGLEWGPPFFVLLNDVRYLSLRTHTAMAVKVFKVLSRYVTDRTKERFRTVRTGVQLWHWLEWAQYSDRLQAGRMCFSSLQELGIPRYHFYIPALRHPRPPIQLLRVVPSSGIKRIECEANYLHKSKVEVKNAWSHRPLPPLSFMARCLIKHLYITNEVLLPDFSCKLCKWNM
jgi:hypothetical protein